MTNIYLSPDWFDPYGVMFETFFAIVTLLLAVLAFRVRNATGDKSTGSFAWAFTLISVSYIIQSVFNFLILSNLKQSICGSNIYTLAIFDAIGMYIHILFMISGLSVLLYLTLHTEKKRTLALLILISLAFMYLSNNLLHAYYALSVIYLFFISWHFYEHHREKKSNKSLVVAVAFTLLLLSRVVSLWRADDPVSFVAAHFLELAAYLAIIANFYMVFKK